MIEKILIKNEASYDNVTGQRIESLKKINFFYGANGSGKTTISRVIDNQDNFEDCCVTWQANNQLKALVYNRDFVNKNFNADEKLKGIFTLGENEGNVVADIEAAKAEKDIITGSLVADCTSSEYFGHFE